MVLLYGGPLRISLLDVFCRIGFPLVERLLAHCHVELAINNRPCSWVPSHHDSKRGRTCAVAAILRHVVFGIRNKHSSMSRVREPPSGIVKYVLELATPFDCLTVGEIGHRIVPFNCDAI